MKSRKLPIIGVMGSGTEPHEEKASLVGRWIAERGWHLLCGGGGGVMESVSRAFAEVRPRAGSVIGVLPCLEDRTPPHPPPGYPNPWVEIAIRTHLPLSGARGQEALSRNHINVLTSDAIVALPGGHGTASEIRLALRYGRNVVAFLDRPEDIPNLSSEVRVESEWNAVIDFLESRIPHTS